MMCRINSDAELAYAANSLRNSNHHVRMTFAAACQQVANERGLSARAVQLARRRDAARNRLYGA